MTSPPAALMGVALSQGDCPGNPSCWPSSPRIGQTYSSGHSLAILGFGPGRLGAVWQRFAAAQRSGWRLSAQKGHRELRPRRPPPSAHVSLGGPPGSSENPGTQGSRQGGERSAFLLPGQEASVPTAEGPGGKIRPGSRRRCLGAARPQGAHWKRGDRDRHQGSGKKWPRSGPGPKETRIPPAFVCNVVFGTLGLSPALCAFS